MTTKDPWYLAQRAVALALVQLTRRDDVRVQQDVAVGRARIDLLVETMHAGHPTGHVFGIELKARVSASTDAAPLILQDIAANVLVGTGTTPHCLFFFTMADNAGYYAWLLEPAITEDGQPKLQHQRGGELRPLDRIITDVDRWYDALTNALATS